MAWLFWLSLTGIGYTYVGYPLLIRGLARLWPRPVRKGAITPTVSVLIAAHNEIADIGRKLDSVLEQDYPADRFEILVGADGCTDNTEGVVERLMKREPGKPIRLHRFPTRIGKPSVLNALVPHATGEILVFTDARQALDRRAIRRLVENLADPLVGCVSGELELTEDPSSFVGEGLGAYWEYEKSLRLAESQTGSMLGATGALYAIRKTLYRPLDPRTLLDDVEIPLAIIAQGVRAVFEPSALAYDTLARSGRAEFRRKVRTLAGNYQTFIRHARLLGPGSPIAWQLWSHKVFRTLVPFWLLALLIASVRLPGPLYRAATWAQVAGYGLAGLGAVGESLRQPWLGGRLGRMAYVFCLLNVGAVVGLIRFLRSQQPITWEKAHER